MTITRAALTGRKQDAGFVVRIPASEIESRVAQAIGAHLAVQASAIDGCHINHGVLGGTRVIPQHEQTRRLRRDPTSENDVRNAIERTTVSATRIEILVSESVVAEGDELDLRSFRIETPNHISVDAERHDWYRCPGWPRRKLCRLHRQTRPQHARHSACADAFKVALRQSLTLQCATHRKADLCRTRSDPGQHPPQQAVGQIVEHAHVRVERVVHRQAKQQRRLDTNPPAASRALSSQDKPRPLAHVAPRSHDHTLRVVRGRAIAIQKVNP